MEVTTTDLPNDQICQKNPVESSQPSQSPADIRGLSVGVRRGQRPPPPPPPTRPSSPARPLSGQRLTPNGVPIVNNPTIVETDSVVNNNNNNNNDNNNRFNVNSPLQDFSPQLVRSRQRNTPAPPAPPAPGRSVLSSGVKPGLSNLLAIAGDPEVRNYHHY